MDRIKNFLVGERTPRWVLLTGFAITFVLGTLQNEYYHRRELSDRREDQIHSRAYERSVQLEKHVEDFQTFAGAFVTAMLERPEDARDARARLISNLQMQYAAADASSQVLDGEVRAALDRYKAALMTMKEVTEDTGDRYKMLPFWEAASDLIVEKNKVIRQINTLVSQG